MSRPLEGTTVIEVCNVASGPYCGMLLADLGADVIKIENPTGGDQMRSWPPMTNGFSENFASLNRNKRSVALDLKDPVARDQAADMMATCDVVLENNRPGVMNRLGLGFSDIATRNAAVVYCSISAFGQTGPRSTEAGFDLTIQAISGIISVTGEPGRPPVKSGVPVSDFATGLYAALGIVSALISTRRTGQGAHIDISMLGSSLAIAALQTSQLFGTGVDPIACGAAHPRNAPYEVFACRDGYVAIAAGNNKIWHALCHGIDQPDLAANPDFATNQLRAQNQTKLKGVLEEHFADYEMPMLLEVLKRAGVPSSPINSYSDALADPQVEAMAWVEPMELPDGTVTRTFGSPIRFDNKGFPAYRRPPVLGEHTDEIIDASGVGR